MASAAQWRELCTLLSDAEDVQRSPHIAMLYEYAVEDAGPMLATFRFDRTLVEDLAHDALLKVLRNAEQFVRAGEPRAYFRAAIQRLATDHRRRASTRREVLTRPKDDAQGEESSLPDDADTGSPLRPQPASPHDRLEERERFENLRQAFSRLSERDQRVLAMASEPDVDAQAVADELGVTRANAYQLICRARKRLEKLMDPDA